MRNIANKIETLRTATAETRVKISQETLRLLKEGKTPKGDPLPLAKAAAIMAAKKTSDLIPYCHPILIDSVDVEFEIPLNPPFDPSTSLRAGDGGQGGFSELKITVTVTAVAKTGVEMEALTAASVAALTIYDMLKPIDKEMEILGCRLLEKKGGKSDYHGFVPKGLKVAVLVTSDGTALGQREDKSGKLIQKKLSDFGIASTDYRVLPDDQEKIRNELLALCETGCDLIITTGGTGLGPRDVTVEATREIIERDIPGISEAMRSYGQRRTPYAMLSRGLVGIRGRSLIINLPGSSKGVEESMSAIFPAVFHIFPITQGGGHS